MIGIITFVETSRADWALIKLNPCFYLKSEFYTGIFSKTHMWYKRLQWLFNNNAFKLF